MNKIGQFEITTGHMSTSGEAGEAPPPPLKLFKEHDLHKKYWKVFFFLSPTG